MLAQQHQGPGSYLRFLHLNDPGGRDDNSSMSPQRAGFLNVMQHEAGHLIVKLKGKEAGQQFCAKGNAAARRNECAHMHACTHTHIHTLTEVIHSSSLPNQSQELRDQISNSLHFTNW